MGRRGMTEASPATLTILHISGIRARAGEDGLQALLEGLRRDLGELADSRGLRPDLLVVTGDLADGGLPQEYHLAFDFLARLAAATGIPRRHVAVVPGRHDVNRKLCESYFNHQEGLGQPTTAPYFPKWQPYAAALADFSA